MSNGEEHPGAPDPYRTVAQMVPGQAILGRYTLTRILGRGGFGVVWEVHDNELDMDVAIKFLSDIIVSNPEAVDDLKRETKFSLRLTHPNIVRIYGFVQDPTVAGISMEFVDGGTLSALKVKRPNRCFDVDTLAPLTERLCDALDYAHKRVKIAHRDLKPGNLMVDSSGDLKVADFGISRSISDTQTALTQVASSGTPAFMSPQQMMGEPASHSDDIYSLGGTLYDLLAGKPPFYTGNIIEQVRTVSPVAISARRQELGIEAPPVPPQWEEVIRACLEKEAQNRPSSAAEVANRLGLRISGASTTPVALNVGPGDSDDESSNATPPGSRIPTSPSGVSSQVSAADPGTEISSPSPAAAAAGGTNPSANPATAAPASGRPNWILPVSVAVLVAVAAGGWWFTRSGSSGASPSDGGTDVASRVGAASVPSASAPPEQDRPDVSTEDDAAGRPQNNRVDEPADQNSDGVAGRGTASTNRSPEGEALPGDIAGKLVPVSPAVGSTDDAAAAQADIAVARVAQIQSARDLVTRAISRGRWDDAESALSAFRPLSPSDTQTASYEAQIAEGREVQQLRRQIPLLLTEGRPEPARRAIAALLRRRPGDRDATAWQRQLREQENAAISSPPVIDAGTPAGASDDRARIESLIESYEVSLETVDFQRFVGLWSELSREKRSNFEKAFNGVESQTIEMVGAPRISIEGDRATVNLNEKRKMTMSAGSDFDVEVNSLLSLVRVDGAWKIRDLEAR